MNAVIKNLAFALLLVVVVNTHHVDFHVYVDGGCGGHSTMYPITGCITFPNYVETISAVRIDVGSCAWIYHKDNADYCDKTGRTHTWGWPNRDLCDLPSGWNHRVHSGSTCGSRSVSVNCPSGSYVRKIDYKLANEGMTIHCYKPTEDTPTYSKNTHDKSLSSPSSTKCPIASHGFVMRYDNSWEMYDSPSLRCVPESKEVSEPSSLFQNLSSSIGKGRQTYSLPSDAKLPNNTKALLNNGKNEGISAYCDLNDDAMTGVSVVIDDVDVIKEVGLRCSRIPDPSKLCEPLETLGVIVQCDNTGSGNEMECSYSQTIGFGQSRTLTETERKEESFYTEFGFTYGVTMPTLAVSMSATLGHSELVGYEWSASDSTTWSLETTVEAKILVKPGVHSKLEQLTGKCSFYGTSVNFFKQTDINSTGVESVRYFSV